jgi:Ulp1 family protease
MMVNWKNFIKNRTALKNLQPWSILNLNHSIQTDGFNCGVFICFFLEKIMKNESLVLNNMSIDEYRHVIRNKIISNC